MWARIGKTYSPISGEEVKRDTVTDVVDAVGTRQRGPAVYGLCPRSTSRRPLTEGPTRHLATARLCPASRRRPPRFPGGHGSQKRRGHARPRRLGAWSLTGLRCPSRCGLAMNSASGWRTPWTPPFMKGRDAAALGLCRWQPLTETLATALSSMAWRLNGPLLTFSASTVPKGPAQCRRLWTCHRHQ